MNNRENSKNWNEVGRRKLKRQVKFCYTCLKLKTVDEFRSKGYNRFGTLMLQSKCRDCEKKETWKKSPKRLKLIRGLGRK